MTPADKAKAVGLLGVLGVLAFAPVIGAVVADKWDERQARKALKRQSEDEN